MYVKCEHCGHQEDAQWLNVAPTHEKFFYQCEKGCPPSKTGHEKAIRTTLEAQISYGIPRVTSMRASALSFQIYERANSAKFSWIELSDKTKKALEKNSNAHVIVQEYPVFGRAWRGLLDDSLVAMVVVFENKGQLQPYTIYVVFRGSVGSKNAGAAGWMSKSQKVNVDWRANFDNVQDFADYGGASFMIHGGYKSSVGSYRDRVYAALAQAQRSFPGSNIVITGHSQGAGHAVLFTHWLAYKDPLMIPNLFCMPFSPPRVGDYRFATDFNNKIVARKTLLPYDGAPSLGAMFVIKGHDPVSFDMERAYAWKATSQEHAISLRKWASAGIVRGGLAAKRKEKKYGGAGLQVYFHPSCLKVLPGARIAKGLLQVLNHKPDWIRDQIRNEFKATM